MKMLGKGTCHRFLFSVLQMQHHKEYLSKESVVQEFENVFKKIYQVLIMRDKSSLQ